MSANSPISLRITGRIQHCTCRTTTSGNPLLELRIAGERGQGIRAMHLYHDHTPATHHVAQRLSRQLQGKRVEIWAVNPRFNAKGLDCDAVHIQQLEQEIPVRKDLS